MAEDVNVLQLIDRSLADRPEASRRKFVGMAAATLGGLGLMSLPSVAMAKHEDTQTIVNVAATAEVLATIINTVGWEKGLGGDAVTQRNIKAAAREELVHYQVLASLGGKAASFKVWIPDVVFSNRRNFLNTLQVGDQIFINAYLVAVHAFGQRRMEDFAVFAAEFMGVEAVHRALARQSLGLLGNDRVFMKFDQKEMAPGAPNRGQEGFDELSGAVRQLLAAGFNFGSPGARPGRFYDFQAVSRRTPTDPALNTFRPDAN